MYQTTNDTVLASMEVTIRPLIDNDSKRILEVVFQITLVLFTSLFGIILNIFNITVYWKQGLRDSITLGFFTLSLSDLTVVSCSLFISVCYVAKFIFPNVPINFIGFHYVSTANLRQMAYSFSTLLTASLSLERCCCVIVPFKVKMIFTRKRTFLFIMCLLVVHIACYIPVYATNQLRWIRDPKRNNTKTLRVWLAPNRKEIEDFNFTLMSIITPVCAQVMVICSSAIMVNGLRSSSRFRQMATAKGGEKGEREGGLTSRDARLVKAMVFVGGILSVCNIPYLALVCAMLLVPELDIGRAYHNTYSVIFSISVLLAIFNASSNFVVYYKISNKYRQIFNETFCSKSKLAEESIHATDEDNEQK